MTKTQFVRFSHVLFILTICGIITGALYIQLVQREYPCPLCLSQRLGMIGVATAILLNLKFGIKTFHYGIGLLFAFFGGWVALRQITLHICPEFPTYGDPVWGFSLYVWSFFTFVCSFLAIAVLLMLYHPDQSRQMKMRFFEKFAALYLILIVLGNIITTLMECGITPCPR